MFPFAIATCAGSPGFKVQGFRKFTFLTSKHAHMNHMKTIKRSAMSSIIHHFEPVKLQQMHVLLRLSACRTLESSPYARVTPAEKPAAPASRRITPPTSHPRGAPSNGNRFWEKRKPLPHTVTETRGRGHRNPEATANGNQQGAGRRLLCSHCRGPKADPPLARPEVDKTQMKTSMHWGTHPHTNALLH